MDALNQNHCQVDLSQNSHCQVGYAQLQGQRRTMEDRLNIQLNKKKNHSYFAVYDGHERVSLIAFSIVSFSSGEMAFEFIWGSKREFLTP